MKVEVLFPEYCNLFADSSNIKYLSLCIPDAEFIYTKYTDEPVFSREEVNLVYMGAMTEKTQLRVIEKLKPYKARLEELIAANVPFLVTGNAVEIFCNYIEHEDGSRSEALGIFNFCAKQDMLHRYNGLVCGKFMDMTILGFKTQFTMAYAEQFDEPFITVRRGCGMNKHVDVEGVKRNSFFGTYLVGPFLIVNPHFTKYLMELMGVKEPKLAFEDVIFEAYKRRLEEFNDPKVKYEE